MLTRRHMTSQTTNGFVSRITQKKTPCCVIWVQFRSDAIRKHVLSAFQRRRMRRISKAFGCMEERYQKLLLVFFKGATHAVYSGICDNTPSVVRDRMGALSVCVGADVMLIGAAGTSECCTSPPALASKEETHTLIFSCKITVINQPPHTSPPPSSTHSPSWQKQCDI